MLSVRVSCQPTSLPVPLALSSSSSSISWRSLARRSLSAWVKGDHSASSALTTYCVKGIKGSKNRNAHCSSNLYCGALVGLKYVSLSLSFSLSLEPETNIFLNGKTNSGEACSKSCDMSQHCVWPDMNFDIPQCFSWQSPSVFSCRWKLHSGCLQIALPRLPHGLLQMLLWGCLAFFLLTRTANSYQMINTEKRLISANSD